MCTLDCARNVAGKEFHSLGPNEQNIGLQPWMNYMELSTMFVEFLSILPGA